MRNMPSTKRNGQSGGCVPAIEAKSPASPDELDPAPYGERFVRVMDDDLNTAQAVAVLFDLGRDIFRARDSGTGIEAAQTKLKELTGVLGLTLEDAADAVDGRLSDEEVERLVAIRTELRKARRYADADAARAELEANGIRRSRRTGRDYLGAQLTRTAIRQLSER